MFMTRFRIWCWGVQHDHQKSRSLDRLPAPIKGKKMQSKKETLTDAVRGLADDLKDYVAVAEGSPIKTSKNNYARYMGLLEKLSSNRPTARLLAEALVLAGANPQGVSDALAIVSRHYED